MEKTKHTPGPWHVERTARQLILSAQGTVASPWMHDKIGALESIANARLIAAAPELLDALTALMKRAAYDAETYTADDSAPIWAFISDAADAIAKARGE